MTEPDQTPDSSPSTTADDDGLPDEVTTAAQRADQFHQTIDEIKRWARETSTDLACAAETADSDEEREKILELRQMVETVYLRIEDGDTSRVRSL